ncbi:MAG: PD40 domain-containing protein, partial [Phycisphaerae bacterium]|nr:PD40 domain-containing protein [Phycisphaerae bacterium]
MFMFVAAAVVLQPSSAGVPAAGSAPVDWKAAEAPYLTDHVQLTLPDRFARAGEAYFDHQSPPRWVVFQAIERPPAGAPKDAPVDTNYAMYVAKLRYEGARVMGLEAPVRVSPAGSANTCGWFDPREAGTVVYGSTMVAPAQTDSPGYSRDRQRYSWQFPVEMEIVSVTAGRASNGGPDWSDGARTAAKVLGMSRPGYDAEGSWSADRRHYLYTHVAAGTSDPNIWVWDDVRREQTPLVGPPGYDGGPFFGPDGKWICYRSDRKGNNELQLFIAELARDDASDPGRITGTRREIQLTDADGVVSWCPYWHPSGSYLVYASSAAGGHQNYEVMAIDLAPALATAPGAEPPTARTARLTHAPGF